MLSRLWGPWFRVASVAAPARAASVEGDFVSVLPAALTAARRDRPLVSGWVSPGGGAALRLVTNAGPVAAPATPGGAELNLLFPTESRGHPLTEGTEGLDGLLDGLVWGVCAGRPAPPLVEDGADRSAEEARRPSLFELSLTALIAERFAWLVLAEPGGDLDAVRAEVQDRLSHLRLRSDRSATARFDVEAAERRLAELDRFADGGLWRIRVLVGADSPDRLARLAPVLTGSVEPGGHGYRLRTGLQGLPLDRAVALREPAADPGGFAVPFTATAGVVPALVGVARREVPGLRVTESGHFDVTNEGEGQAGGAAGDRLGLGAILDGLDRPVGPFTVSRDTLNRHTFVTGATGGGKSQTVRHLLEQLARGGVPWLAIEPAKSEYAAMGGRLAGVEGPLGRLTVINPSDTDAVPVSVNPLAPEPGYPVQAHIDLVRALFLAAFDAQEPFPQIIAQALQEVYRANGWDTVTSGPLVAGTVPTVPTLAQLQATALATVAEVGYGPEIAANVTGFVDVRIRSLRTGSAGRFFEGGHPVSVAELLERNVVLQIEDIASDEDKAFLMGLLIIRIVEHLRLRARAGTRGGLRHVLVIEEAHRLLRNRGEGSPAAHAVELFASLLAEIRAYGTGIVVAEQIPAKLIPDVVKNTACKIVHRLPAADDRELVGSAMNLDEDQSRQVVSLRPGQAAVFTDGMDRPLRVQIPLGEGREAVTPSPTPPIAQVHSPSCPCVTAPGGPCTLRELRFAELAATAATDAGAWLRLWTEILIMGHLTGNPLPSRPPIVHNLLRRLDVRLRAPLVAALVDQAVTRRTDALRRIGDPADLARTVAVTAHRHGLVGSDPGTAWVTAPMAELVRAVQAGRRPRLTAATAAEIRAALFGSDLDTPAVADTERLAPDGTYTAGTMVLAKHTQCRWVLRIPTLWDLVHP
ncbi:ATP-binding protein [Allonocardiopsis opalescens]|uniref:DNA helicase HerA-like ATPase n=1 Tax=Allonocardiopsis opalescens TaxID=1144618 RepID=A0A2T0QE37_9ACTN|nr:ATP-binding protein [Allonocardiopsis opalescens]PRY02140.1 DNA helicase HerA-like ATPase [Allonocardiopsis opalescens]